MWATTVSRSVSEHYVFVRFLLSLSGELDEGAADASLHDFRFSSRGHRRLFYRRELTTSLANIMLSHCPAHSPRQVLLGASATRVPHRRARGGKAHSRCSDLS